MMGAAAGYDLEESSGVQSSCCAAMVANVSPNCEKNAPIKDISSEVLFLAILQANAVIDITNSHDCI